MPSRYQYSVVRYVPNVVRDEGVNVGIIVRGLEGPPLKARFLPRSATVRKLWPEADQQLVVNFEKQLNKAISSDAPLGTLGRVSDPAFFEKARYEFNGNLQLTEVRGHRSDRVEEAARELYETFVAEPAGGPRPINYQAIAPLTVRNKVWSAFERRKLLATGLVQRSYVLDGRHAPWTFDLAFQNGQLNIMSALALNAPTLETNLGRALVFKGMVDEVRQTNKVSQEIQGTAIVQMPAEEKSGPGSRQAVNILQDASIAVVDMTKLDELVNAVEQALRTH